MTVYRPLSETYAAAPQIEPADVAEIAAAGFTTVICNRPDSENPVELQAAVLQAACEAAGLEFVFNPMAGGMSAGILEEQEDAMASSEGPVLAYCASGMRSAILWGCVQAKTMSVDDILTATSAQGYSLGQFQGLFESLSQR